MTPDKANALREAAERATPGPWCVEQCGDKCDAPAVGIAWREDDHDCENPMSGWLRPYDDEGREIAYYREAIACDIQACDGASASANAAYIALADPPTIIDLLAERERLRGALRACIDRIEKPSLSPDANYVVERARQALEATDD